MCQATPDQGQLGLPDTRTVDLSDVGLSLLVAAIRTALMRLKDATPEPFVESLIFQYTQILDALDAS